ncbi:hypothetical protein Nepgr_016049 [Nepenthes gracilis]|uniref:Protein FLUORESCENT IN BLUE LIGHT, chloroplastic-like n=1 Tax=Nepenthes gracilis TaxID=150966 RepID=A0AAD3SM09_NEPGR|nr:hypothetical protein Nepgr_016049 [Nepenthes gracilis]
MPLPTLSLQNNSFRPGWICDQGAKKRIERIVENKHGCNRVNFQLVFPGNSASLLFDLKKFILSASGAPGESNVCNGCQISKSDGVSDVHLSQVSEANFQRFYINQETLITRFPAASLLLTNGLMMAMPFGALAETCEADNSLFNMPLLLFVAFIGATVGGLLARQRRKELQRLNEQLRQINAALRRQAKIESYAPTLSYAPVGGRITEAEIIVDPKKQELISRLKVGKNYLRNLDPERASEEFKAALQLAQNLNDSIEEKKAARGVGASLQRLGKYREAIKYHSMVLSVSKQIGEDSGNTEAYGAIADCYTELGDLEKAGSFYDKYIARLSTD